MILEKKGDKGDPADLLIATESARNGIKWVKRVSRGPKILRKENGVLSVDLYRCQSKTTQSLLHQRQYVQLGMIEVLASLLRKW